MKNRLPILSLVLILTGLIFSGCAPATETPSPPEAPAEVLAARDAALTYVREHFEDTPAESLVWVEERLTPEDVPGGATWQYTADGWVVTVSYAVLPPEWTVYHIAVSNESTGFEWEGRVDGPGRVPEALVSSMLPARGFTRSPTAWPPLLTGCPPPPSSPWPASSPSWAMTPRST